MSTARNFLSIIDHVYVKVARSSMQVCFAASSRMTKKRVSCRNDDESQRGSMLVEVLVAVVILGLGLTALVSLITASLSSNRAGADRGVANRLAVEGVEWLKQVRTDRGFSAVSGKGDASGSTYCINDLPVDYDDWPSDDLCSSNITGTPFERELVIKHDSANNYLEYIVVISWLEGSRNPVFELEGRMYDW